MLPSTALMLSSNKRQRGPPSLEAQTLLDQGAGYPVMQEVAPLDAAADHAAADHAADHEMMHKLLAQMEANVQQRQIKVLAYQTDAILKNHAANSKEYRDDLHEHRRELARITAHRHRMTEHLSKVVLQIKNHTLADRVKMLEERYVTGGHDVELQLKLQISTLETENVDLTSQVEHQKRMYNKLRGSMTLKNAADNTLLSLAPYNSTANMGAPLTLAPTPAPPLLAPPPLPPPLLAPPPPNMGLHLLATSALQQQHMRAAPAQLSTSGEAPVSTSGEASAQLSNPDFHVAELGQYVLNVLATSASQQHHTGAAPAAAPGWTSGEASAQLSTPDFLGDVHELGQYVEEDRSMDETLGGLI
jgi:hypothetical protein